MPRRPRHEARDRRTERRRDIRRKLKELIKRAFLRRLRRAFRRSSRRIALDIQETRERLALLRDIIAGRAKTVFKITKVYYPRRVREFYTYDRFVMDLPEDLRNMLVQVFRSAVVGKYVDPAVINQHPWIRYFLYVFIMYYSKFPCRHISYALKITPATIHLFGRVKITYYILRWARAKDVKADPYIGRSRTVDFYITFLRYKFDPDIINALEVGDEGTNDWNDRFPLARDAYRHDEYVVPLRRAILQPHWVKWAWAKSMGKPEVFTSVDVGHCSAYGIIERPSKTLQLIKHQDRRILGTRPRHRIKEILYRTGLRV